MYHYVRPIKKGKYPEIKGLELERFLHQIDYLKKNYNLINSNHLIDCIYENVQLPPRPAVLTFDDGLKDHYSHVFPILARLKIQGLFFPPAKPIEENIVLDVHKIQFILVKIQNKEVLVHEIFQLIKEHKDEYNLFEPTSYFSKLAIANRFDTKEVVFIKRILQRDLPKKLRSEFTDFLFKKFMTSDEKGFSKELYMSIDNMREMQESGMYFGSHGFAHDWLSSLKTDELNTEIQKSLNFYAKINSDKDELIMCYPYGDYNQEVVSKLSKEGFKAGFTTKVGNALLSKENAFTLKRYDTNDFPQ